MKKLTEKDYKKYMDIINGYISTIENNYEKLNDFKKISKMSFDEWKNWINKGLKN